MQSEQKKEFLLTGAYYAVLAAALYLFLRYLLWWLLPFLLAFAAARAMEPVILLLRRTVHFKRGFSAALLTLFLLFLLGGLLSLLLSALFTEATAFLTQLPTLLDALPALTGGLLDRLGGPRPPPPAVKAAYDLGSQASSAASSAYDLANEAGQVATDAAQTAADAQSAAEAAQAAVGGKAPTNHASTVTTYGKGTSTNYGHVKLSDSILSTSDTAGGTAATPGAVKKAYDLANRAETTLLGGKKIVCGWSAISFKSTGQTNTTINFGTTFTAKPIVIIGQPFNGVICTVFKDSVTTTKFTVNVPAVGSSTVSTRQMAWVAIGSV